LALPLLAALLVVAVPSPQAARKMKRARGRWRIGVSRKRVARKYGSDG
jgi:hypothetical protein